MHAPTTAKDINEGFSESWALNPESEAKGQSKRSEPDHYLTSSQERGLTTLLEYARLFEVLGRQRQGGFAPKLWKLIIGQTGSGKTNLAKQLAKFMHWELLILDCGSWIPHGALAKPPTLQIVRDFVRKNDEGLIFADEICKAVPANHSSSWSLGVFSEVLAFLDGQNHLLGHEWNEADLRKFRSKFYILGGGAFQSAFKVSRANSKKGSLGFQKSVAKAKEGYSDEIFDSELLPEEILTRFSGRLITLSTPTEEDIRNAISRFHRQMKIPIEGDMVVLVAEALDSKAGMRWVEDYVASVLLKHPEKAVAHKEKPIAEESTDRDLFAGIMYHHLSRANDACAGLRTSLARLWGQLAKDDFFLKNHSESRFRHFLFGREPDTVPDIVYRTLRGITLVYDTANVSDDDPATTLIRLWSKTAWEGITHYAEPLTNIGLMPVWVRAWQTSVSILEVRMRIRRMVEEKKLL